MENIKEFVKKIFLFTELDNETINMIICENGITVKSYPRGECIFCKDSGERKIGFVISGKAEVRDRKKDGSFSVLNQLSVGDSFGILAVFSDEEFPTEIFATKNSDILFISEKEIKKLMSKIPKISENVIKFMAERISFLNKKIKTFSGTRASDRLLSYLICKWEDAGRRPFILNCKKCSEAINAGRASVYRAIDYLVSEGIISVENKKIIILKTERK